MPYATCLRCTARPNGDVLVAVIVGNPTQTDHGAMSGGNGIHRFNRLPPTLIVEAGGNWHQRRECQTGETVFGSRLHEFMQGLSDGRPHVWIVIERMGKPALPGCNGEPGVFEFDRTSLGRESFLPKVVSQRPQESPQNVFKEDRICSVALERRLMTGALGFSVGHDRLMVSSLGRALGAREGEIRRGV